MGIKIRHTRALIGFLPIGFRVPIAIPTEEESLLHLGRGPSDPAPRTVRASAESTTRRFVPVFGAQIDGNTWVTTHV
jgi:hypothetical protein